MLQRPFRFLHAAELDLDNPCQIAAEVPNHLIDLLVDTPLLAATKLFDAALHQRVDFVVLSGNVIDPRRAAPHELLFLVQQFQRLADRNIPVYWSGGSADSLPQWPPYVVWPSNVHQFPSGHVQRYRHEIAGAVVCEIIGWGHGASQLPRPYDFAPTSADIFSVALAHANWNAGALGEIGIDYWALGGPHNRSTPLELNCIAHFAGSPQGRCLTETGPHGCTIVDVDEHSHAHLTPIACDVLRWLSPQLSLPATADRGDLERLLLERTEQFSAESPGVALLVTWQIACQGALRFALKHESLGAELISKLRQNFGHRQIPIWTLAIDAALSDQLPASWYAEETLRGDFLRAVQQCSPGFSFGQERNAVADRHGTIVNDRELSGEQQLVLTFPENLTELLSADNQLTISADLLAQIGPAMDSPDARHRLLQEITSLGADLLSPTEAQR